MKMKEFMRLVNEYTDFAIVEFGDHSKIRHNLIHKETGLLVLGLPLTLSMDGDEDQLNIAKFLNESFYALAKNWYSKGRGKHGEILEEELNRVFGD
jgi:hypothetical protein